MGGCPARPRAPRPTVDGLADDADLIIECALEDLALKRTVFRILDDVADASVILATNTSALSVAAIAEATRRPDRVIGLHFFNPAPIMSLVEVVEPPLADPSVVARAVATVTAWGKTPVVCADRPGFIVNRVNRPFTIEALRILETGAATTTEIDQAIREAGFPMGPLELMDLTGIDVTLAARPGSGRVSGVPTGSGRRPSRRRSSPPATSGANPARASIDTWMGGGSGSRHDRRHPPPPSLLPQRRSGIGSSARSPKKHGWQRGGRRNPRRHRSRPATGGRPSGWDLRAATRDILRAGTPGRHGLR
jgi:hypothetical protein